MIVQKKKKETENEHAHIEIYFDGEYLGYIIKNNSGNAGRVGENWNFVSKNEKIENFYDKTKNKIIERLTEKMYRSHV